MNEILTIEEVAQVLKMSRRQIYELTRARTRERSSAPIPMLKINGNTRFRRCDIEAWIGKLAEQGGQR